MAVEDTSAWDYTRPQSHSLPMRMMLRELRAIRGETVYLTAIAESLFAIGQSQRPAAPFTDDAKKLLLDKLEDKLNKQEDAYTALDNEKVRLQSEVRIETMSQPVQLAAFEQRCFEADKPLKRMIHRLRGNALTFSGGGIRSASFCLGILQGLARFTLLGGDCSRDPKVSASSGLLYDTQYLSTVSGGGYLGCWLSSWIARVAAQTSPDLRVTSELSASGRPSEEAFREAYNTTLQGLAGRLPQTGGDPSPESVRHLREFTAYLAPQLGLSLDVWTLLAIATRNMLINWLMLAPLLLFLVTLPGLFIFWLRDLHHFVAAHDGAFLLLLGAVVAWSAFQSGRSLPSYRPWIGAPPSAAAGSVGLARVFAYFVLPILSVCFLLSAHFFALPGSMPPSPSAVDSASLAAIATIGYGILGIFRWWTHYAIYPGGEITNKPPTTPRHAAGITFLVTIVLGAGTGVGLELIGTKILPKIANLHFEGILCTVEPVNYVLFSLPALLTVLLLGSNLLSALTQMWETEEDREWWSRAGGFLGVCGLVWLASTALWLYGPEWHPAFRYTPTISGGILGLITSLVGKSVKTPAGARPGQASQKSSALHRLVLPALAITSLILLAVGLAGVSHALRTQWHGGLLDAHPAVSVLVELFMLAAVSVVVSSLVNINIFSLHGLYRERLMRAFLGASNSARHTDAFTGFDSSDSLYMRDLARCPGVPLHIVNTTLNLVGTRRASWRQRRAESFSFSSISSGAWRLNYVAADHYGGEGGVSVATAMAISGAAANPNMGYHSSPLVTILMTLFNVRLGWWLPNPRFPLDHIFSPSARAEFWHRSGPRLSVWPLLQELFGLTDDSRGYIELTDGGHFENLGLYEMVLRRCGNIIVVDAGADPAFGYEDLGNALRKIRVDLGIPIEFANKPNMHAGEKHMASHKNRYCAVADIRYSCVDDNIFTETAPDGSFLEYNKPSAVDACSLLDGKLIYIKACLSGVDEPMDVTEYSRNHRLFPHEGTGNQFFNEAQFESYRALGSHIVDIIAKDEGGVDWAHWTGACSRHARPPA